MIKLKKTISVLLASTFFFAFGNVVSAESVETQSSQEPESKITCTIVPIEDVLESVPQTRINKTVTASIKPYSYTKLFTDSPLLDQEVTVLVTGMTGGLDAVNIKVKVNGVDTGDYGPIESGHAAIFSGFTFGDTWIMSATSDNAFKGTAKFHAWD